MNIEIVKFIAELKLEDVHVREYQGHFRIVGAIDIYKGYGRIHLYRKGNWQPRASVKENIALCRILIKNHLLLNGPPKKPITLIELLRGSKAYYDKVNKRFTGLGFEIVKDHDLDIDSTEFPGINPPYRLDR